jgi:hypothetical protein
MPRDVLQVRDPDGSLRRQIDELAALWGGIRPLSASEVVREAVSRAVAAGRPKAAKGSAKR